MNGEYIESTYGSIPMKYHHCFTIVSPCLTLLCSKLQYHLAIDRWGHQNPINAHRIHGAAILMVTWIPSIYPSHVSIYTRTMDPMGIVSKHHRLRDQNRFEPTPGTTCVNLPIWTRKSRWKRHVWALPPSKKREKTPVSKSSIVGILVWSPHAMGVRP